MQLAQQRLIKLVTLIKKSFAANESIAEDIGHRFRIFADYIAFSLCSGYQWIDKSLMLTGQIIFYLALTLLPLEAKAEQV